MPSNPERFELVTQKMLYGGAALGHHAGHPVLVPYTLPGERVQVETTRLAKGMIYTRLVQVLEPSPQRVAAPCPYFGRCGGCHYQHLDAARQLEMKREILRETLRRVGHIDWQGEVATHTAEPWGYRNQVRLKIGRRDAASAAAASAAAVTPIGFFAADSHQFVAIDRCPISSPRLNAVIQEFASAEWAARLEGWSEVELRADDRDEHVVVTFRGAVTDSIEGSIERLAGECLRELSGAAGIVFDIDPVPEAPRPDRHHRGGNIRRRQRLTSPRRASGDATLIYRVGDINYRVSPGSFFQASRLLLPEFVSTVIADFEGGSPGLALDLYAGAGLFTLPLTRRFREVVSVEANPEAAADLAANLRVNGAANARAVRSTAAEFLRRYAQAAPDLVVLDPPRAGAEGETLRRLAAIRPAQIRYVSCHPPTLARDLAALVERGYRIERVDLFDLFPQTFHIETLVRLSRV
ncbi:MAG TPA: class I SAM-dependent RNA methyltransferase [Terriglobia bacterium]|nr:class I SAM-dependent RNA methyltransferase [Terriglobia bacterium]